MKKRKEARKQREKEVKTRLLLVKASTKTDDVGTLAFLLLTFIICLWMNHFVSVIYTHPLDLSYNANKSTFEGTKRVH